MGSIHKTKSGRHQVFWRDHNRRQHTKTFDRKTDARRFLTTTEADITRGVWINPRDGRITLAEYIAKWAPVQSWKASTRAQVDSHLRTHIIPQLGDRHLQTITRTDLLAFVKHLGESGLSPSTTEAVYRRLMTILRAAVDDEIMAKTPRPLIRQQLLGAAEPRPVVNSDQPQVLQSSEVAALAEAVPARLRAFVLVMAGAGLRPAEAAGLSAERVSRDPAELIIDRQLVTTSGMGAPYLATPKTAASVRRVPVLPELLEVLNDHEAQHPPAQILDSDGTPAVLLFTNRDGRPLRRNVLGDGWQRYAPKAGIPPHFRGWHQLRHYYASKLISAGVPITVIQANLGHANSSETLDTYSHLFPDDQQAAREAIRDALFGIN